MTVKVEKEKISRKGAKAQSKKNKESEKTKAVRSTKKDRNNNAFDTFPGRVLP